MRVRFPSPAPKNRTLAWRWTSTRSSRTTGISQCAGRHDLRVHDLHFLSRAAGRAQFLQCVHIGRTALYRPRNHSRGDRVLPGHVPRRSSGPGLRDECRVARWLSDQRANARRRTGCIELGAGQIAGWHECCDRFDQHRRRLRDYLSVRHGRADRWYSVLPENTGHRPSLRGE